MTTTTSAMNCNRNASAAHRSPLPKLMRYVVFALLLSASATHAQETEYPRFGLGLALLTIPDTFINNVAFSSQGEYVVVTANQLDRELISQGFNPTFRFLRSSQYLWRIPNNLLDGLNWLEPDQHLILDKQERQVLGPDFAFSPDTRFLATKTDTQVKLYRFPSFILEDAISVNNPIQRFNTEQFNQVQWSLDSQVVATLDGTEIVAWDTLTDEVRRYDLGIEHDRIISLQVGWYAYIDDAEQPNGFAVCGWRLEQCNVYEFPTSDIYVKLPSPDGQIIFTTSRDVGSSDQNLLIWRRQDDGSYLAETPTTSSELSLYPISFSYSSQFLLSAIGTSRYDTWRVWDFSTLRPISTVSPTPSEAIWLQDNNHFITFDAFRGRDDWNGYTFRLYEVGNETPLDEIQLPIEKIDGFDLVFASTESDLMQISIDGKRLLLKAGFGVFVIPISYRGAE
jgi:hypothetical protein